MPNIGEAAVAVGTITGKFASALRLAKDWQTRSDVIYLQLNPDSQCKPMSTNRIYSIGVISALERARWPIQQEYLKGALQFQDNFLADGSTYR